MWLLHKFIQHWELWYIVYKTMLRHGSESSVYKRWCFNGRNQGQRNLVCWSQHRIIYVCYQRTSSLVCCSCCVPCCFIWLVCLQFLANFFLQRLTLLLRSGDSIVDFTSSDYMMTRDRFKTAFTSKQAKQTPYTYLPLFTRIHHLPTTLIVLCIPCLPERIKLSETNSSRMVCLSL